MNVRVPLFCLLLLLTSFTIAAAQAGAPVFPSQRSPHFSGDLHLYGVSGSVLTPDNHPVQDARVEVRTLSTQQVVASGYTLPNGNFEFSNLPAGTYDITATSGVAEASERVEVDQPQTTVHLRIATASNQDSGNATVSVSQLKVPDKAKKQYVKAEEAFRKHKFDEARDRVQKALSVLPDYAQALTLRGLLELRDNQFQPAAADLERAIHADSSYPLAYVVLGATYNFMSRYADAARTLEHAIVLAPASWQARFELAKALLGKGEFAPALRQLNKAADFAPSSYAAIHLVKAHALLGLKNYNDAVTELEHYLGADPNSPDSAAARQTLGQVRAFLANNNGK